MRRLGLIWSKFDLWRGKMLKFPYFFDPWRDWNLISWFFRSLQGLWGPKKGTLKVGTYPYPSFAWVPPPPLKPTCKLGKHNSVAYLINFQGKIILFKLFSNIFVVIISGIDFSWCRGIVFTRQITNFTEWYRVDCYIYSIFS